MKHTMKHTLTFLLTLTLVFCMLTGSSLAAGAGVFYQAHVQNQGDQPTRSNGEIAGTTGQSLRLEELRISLQGINAFLIAKGHVQNQGWSSERRGSSVTIGTRGLGLRLEAVTLALGGPDAKWFSIQYRVHVAELGWLPWTCDGAEAGTVNRALRIEAIQIKLVPNGFATQNYYVCTNGANLNVRSASSASASVIGKLANGTKVNVLSISGGWAKIRFDGGTIGYVSADYLTTNPPQANPFQAPLNNRVVRQAFGNRPSSPPAGRPYHSGVDLVSSDTSVHAAASGIVKYRGYSENGNGYHIILQHTINGQTVYTLYSHLTNLSLCPAQGASVSKGQQIGVMGNTGRSFGAHLHFAVFTGSFSADPVGYTNDSGTTRASYRGQTFYNPETVLSLGKLP